MREFFAEGYQEAKQEPEVKKQYMYCGRASGKSRLELTKFLERTGMINKVLPLEDKLEVTFTYDPLKDETGICIARNDTNGEYHILKMLLDEDAKELYKIITDQTYGPHKEGAERKERLWIPVTERLPEETGWYLCTLPMRLEEPLIDICIFNKVSGIFLIEDGTEYYVSAWTPLPKPFEKGETNESE